MAQDAYITAMTDLSPLLQPDRGQPARSIHLVHPDKWAEWLKGQPARVRTAIAANKLTGKAGNRAVLPGDKDDDWSMLLVCDEAETSPFRIASLGEQLPVAQQLVDPGDRKSHSVGHLGERKNLQVGSQYIRSGRNRTHGGHDAITELGTPFRQPGHPELYHLALWRGRFRT